MISDYIVGNKYYIKTDNSLVSPIPATNTEQIYLHFNAGDGKYRINGGSWVSASSILIQITQNYARLNINGTIHPFGSSTEKTFEIYGTLYYKGVTSPDLSPYPYLKSVAIQNPIEIELDTLNCEPHLVSKTASTNLLYKDTAYGLFREEQNILTPSIVFEYSKVPDFNYVYIPSLSRYYFVTNVTLVRNNIYRVDLKVDVLCTYDSDIRLQNCFVSRSGSIGNETMYLIDERVPLNKIPQISKTKLTPVVSSGLVFNPNKNTSDYTIVVSVVTNNASAYTQTGSKNNIWDSNLPEITNLMGNSPAIYSYAITYSDWVNLCQKLLDDDSLETYIVNAIMYPFNVSNDAFVSAGLKPIYLGTENSGVSGYIMQGTFSHYRYYWSHQFSKRYTGQYNEFLNYEPYRKFDIYLPFHGWVNLDTRKITGKTIYIYYEHNYVTGNSQVLIYNHTDNVLLDTYPVNVGVKLPISSTNARENQNQRDTATLNMIMGLYGSAIQMGTGAMSDKLGSVLGGGLSGAKAVMSKVNSDMYIYEKASTAMGSDMLTMLTPMDCWVREIYHTPEIYFNLTDFVTINGYKWDEYGDITTLGCSGHTEIPEMHYVPSTYKFITKTEIDEIVSLAKNGIIL